MTTRCESCSMTIESGPYCQYCTDHNGSLHPFEETVERFKQLTRREEPALGEEEVLKKVLGHMATMPAWRDHPGVIGRSS